VVLFFMKRGSIRSLEPPLGTRKCRQHLQPKNRRRQEVICLIGTLAGESVEGKQQTTNKIQLTLHLWMAIGPFN